LEVFEREVDDQLIFPIPVIGFRLAWERLLSPTGIRDPHFDALRHEEISRLFEIGLTEVALLSGPETFGCRCGAGMDNAFVKPQVDSNGTSADAVSSRTRIDSTTVVTVNRIIYR
jgi:hypothetical protein